MTDESIMSMLYRILGELADIRELISEKNDQLLEKDELMPMLKAAEYMRMTDNNFCVWYRRNGVSVEKINNRLFFKKSELDRLLKTKKHYLRPNSYKDISFEELQKEKDSAFFSAYEASKYLSVSSSTIYALRSKGIIPSKKTSKGVRFLKSDLDKYLNME